MDINNGGGGRVLINYSKFARNQRPVNTKYLYNIYTTPDVGPTLYKCEYKCFVFTGQHVNPRENDRPEM